MFWIKEMGKYAGSMRTRAVSGAETIHVNGEVLEYLIQGNQHGYCAVHTPQCRIYATMPYIRHNAVCRMKYAVREHASSLLSRYIRQQLFWKPPYFANNWHSAPFQITVLVRFRSVWFSLVTVLLFVYPRSLLLCPFHKKTENLMEEVLRFLSNR